MADGIIALVLNRKPDRLRETGVVIVSKATERILMVGVNPLSKRLASDYQRPFEYHVETNDGKKTVFWLPNKIQSFCDSAPGYYRYGGYELLRQEIAFEPSVHEAIYLTDTFFVTDQIAFEKVQLTSL